MRQAKAIREEQGLIPALRQSDRDAYEKIFKRLYRPVYLQVLYRCRDRDLAEDIVQETFVRLWMKRGSLKQRIPLFPYLLAIAVNLLRDHARHSSVVLQHNESIRANSDFSARDTEEPLKARLLQDRISEVVIKNLSETCRSVFILSRMEGMDNAEIAGLLHISLKSVENHLYHALKVLRKKLSAFQ